jgi:RNA polymerase sigma-70 factor (ECF subfamily)
VTLYSARTAHTNQDMQDNFPQRESQEYFLVRQAIKGDAQAFAELCEKYRQRVWRVAASVTKSNADADDLAQEAFVRAFGAVKNYRPNASFEAWLCRIALNAAQDYQKSAWRRKVMFWGTFKEGHEASASLFDSSADQVVTPHLETERRELRRRVRAAVAELKPREAVPIWLIYFEEFTLAEVARLESEPESTVRSRVRSGLKKLERKLGDLRVFIQPEEDSCPEENQAQEAGTSSEENFPLSESLCPAPLGLEMKGRAATCP